MTFKRIFHLSLYTYIGNKVSRTQLYVRLKGIRSVYLYLVIGVAILITTAGTSALIINSKKTAQVTKNPVTSSKKVASATVKKSVVDATKVASNPPATTPPAPSTSPVVTKPVTKSPKASTSKSSTASLSQSPFLSNIWTGYEIEGSNNEYTMAEGTIVVPTVTCSNNYTQFSLWVGLDGADSGNTIEQEGIRAMCETTPISCNTNCTSATPSYFIWTEMYPLNFVQQTLTISPGDTLFMKVNYIGNNEYDMYFDDETTGGTFDINQACPSGSVCQNSTAEWISENHLAAGTLISLFGSAAFTGAQVGTAQNASPTPFTDYTNYPLEAYVNGEQQESVTYPLNQGVSSFTIKQLVND
jgi:hypothetical protein